MIIHRLYADDFAFTGRFNASFSMMVPFCSLLESSIIIIRGDSRFPQNRNYMISF